MTFLKAGIFFPAFNDFYDFFMRYGILFKKPVLVIDAYIGCGKV
jgi:hypothetical protein